MDSINHNFQNGSINVPLVGFSILVNGELGTGNGVCKLLLSYFKYCIFAGKHLDVYTQLPYEPLPQVWQGPLRMLDLLISRQQ
jgi:hypothetical protein